MYFYRAFAPGMSFLRAMAAALWDSYSTKAKPRFFILSTALGYTITSTTPSVTCIYNCNTKATRYYFITKCLIMVSVMYKKSLANFLFTRWCHKMSFILF